MIYTKLAKIQQELKAPKNQYNSFSNFKYRSAENILEAVKPYEDKYSVCLILQDDIIQIGDRHYVKAIATLIDIEDNSSVTVSAFARESESKKGMDASQITGATSSYARKYALNGLFLLDDSKDADTDEYQSQTRGKAPSYQGLICAGTPSIDKQKAHIKALCEKNGVNLKTWLESYNLEWNKLTAEDCGKMMKALQSKFGNAS